MEGLSVTRAANGDLVFVDYTPDNGDFGGTNCGTADPDVAIVDIAGRVIGGTGNFDGASGQFVHTLSDIYPTSTDFNFGGTDTVSHNQCLND